MRAGLAATLLPLFSGEAEYVTIMSSLKLPNPALMDVAVPANLACGEG